MSYTYDLIAETEESTIVAEYEAKYDKSDKYQSEADLEKEFIRQLQNQGYEYLPIHQEADLVTNLRKQLTKLNNYEFTDNEWKNFFLQIIANNNNGIVEKTKIIQEDYVQNLKKEDGSTKNIKLIDKQNIHNNFLQVINQYEQNNGTDPNRYDVSILVNGLPLVHIELKRRGVPIREAFNQINRYQRESFWAGTGLYEYIQIFVISNGTFTKYYSNTTRTSHIKENTNSGKATSKKTSNSFEFTSYWADSTNKTITDLVDFSKTFLAKHTILNILTKYCIFTTENMLLVMRPYQICATERILNKIQISSNYKQYGSVAAGGYIWHTTGSGKTLTSFKTSQIASKLPYIDKVLFIVDRKDLDYQTMKEYERFEKGCANGNNSTAVLKRQLEDTDENGGHKEYNIIVSTIQKLDNFVSKNKNHPIYDKHIVIIFDECHRSQFGDMRTKITKAFKKYHIFGFTGTPIFAQNAKTNTKYPNLITTEQAFGEKLHTYTMVDAIRDANVLPFRIDYVNTLKAKENINDKNIPAIDRDKALKDEERIAKVVDYVLEHFEQKTKRNSSYDLKGQRKFGFNSIFACSSIPVLKQYYLEFQKQCNEKHKNLSVAAIFSYGANEEESGTIEDGTLDTDGLDATSKQFLSRVINDYNIQFNTNFNINGDSFQNYYKDLSLRVKNREVDILLVVNMFLTGFDATTLNTLWVDKNLKMHGLIQAFSRTNRILNSVKTYGNIVCFRDLEQETNDAISLFCDKDASGIVLLKTFDDYYHGYTDKNNKHIDGYEEIVKKLVEQFPLGTQIETEEKQKEFILLFGTFLRLKNILSSFDRFYEDNIKILSDREVQDYQSVYLDIHDKHVNLNKSEKEDISDDLIFEMELIKQVEVNIDYILMLVEKYHEGHCVDKEMLATIQKAVGASPELRSKKALIENFISTINVSSNVSDDWKQFVREQEEKELVAIIQEENLKEQETRQFVANSFKDGAIKEIGQEIASILPPMSVFGGKREKKKKDVLEKLKAFFEKFFGLGLFEE